MYDEVGYWSGRPNPNSIGTGLSGKLRHVIRRHVPKDGKVLDFGCGIGRVVTAYNHASEVLGVDIHQRYFDKFKEEAERCGLKAETQVVGLDYKLPTGFDVALAIDVFLHVKPNRLLDAINGLRKSAPKVIMQAFSNPNRGNLAPHCFCHDYRAALRATGKKIIEWNQVGEKAIIVYC